MSCNRLKFLLNEYEYYSHNQAPLGGGSIPIGANCVYLNTVPSQNHNLQYYLGTDYENLEPPDTLAIFGLRDLLEVAGATSIAVIGADDPLFALNAQVFNTLVTLSDLKGLTNDDLYLTFDTFTQIKPYWLVLIFTTNVCRAPVRKIMLGKSFSFERNPILPVEYSLNMPTVEAVRNNIDIQMNFRALSDTSKLELINKMLLNQDYINGALIDTENLFLFNKKIMMFKLSDNTINIRPSGHGYDLTLGVQGIL